MLGKCFAYVREGKERLIISADPYCTYVSMVVSWPLHNLKGSIDHTFVSTGSLCSTSPKTG